MRANTKAHEMESERNGKAEKKKKKNANKRRRCNNSIMRTNFQMTIDSFLNSPNAERREKETERMNEFEMRARCLSFECVLPLCPGPITFQSKLRNSSPARGARTTMNNWTKWKTRNALKRNFSVHAAALLGNSTQIYIRDTLRSEQWANWSKNYLHDFIMMGLSDAVWFAHLEMTTRISECRVCDGSSKMQYYFLNILFFRSHSPSSLSVGPNLCTQKYTFHSSFCSLHFVFGRHGNFCQPIEVVRVNCCQWLIWKR